MTVDGVIRYAIIPVRDPRSPDRVKRRSVGPQCPPRFSSFTSPTSTSAPDT